MTPFNNGMFHGWLKGVELVAEKVSNNHFEGFVVFGHRFVVLEFVFLFSNRVRWVRRELV